MAAKTQSLGQRLVALWNHPAGPKTVRARVALGGWQSAPAKQRAFAWRLDALLE